MGEAGGGMGQFLRKMKLIHPAGQRITFVLLERISKSKVWSPTGLYSLLHYLKSSSTQRSAFLSPCSSVASIVNFNTFFSCFLQLWEENTPLQACSKSPKCQ